MNTDPIKIRKIRLKHLKEFAQESLWNPAFVDVAPISLLRAESQSKNPQAGPDDIALLVALHENRCIGYHGLLPGLLMDKDRPSKIHWLVTFYLKTEYRGKGYGKQLVSEIQNTKLDLVTTGITDSAAGVYLSAGFQKLAELPYCQLRPASTNLYTELLQNLKPRENTFIAKSVNYLSENIENTAARQGPKISFHRGIKTINWMIRNPWVVSKPKARQDVKHYYFSRVRDLFKFIALEIFALEGKARKGFLVLSISRKKHKTTLKVLDFYFHDPKDIFITGYFALKYAKYYRADQLEFPMGLKSVFGDQAGLTQIIKRKKRLYLFHPRSNGSPLLRLAQKIELNYCDSDTAFT